MSDFVAGNHHRNDVIWHRFITSFLCKRDHADNADIIFYASEKIGTW